MSEVGEGERSHGGSHRESVEHDHQPYWKRAHRDWRFWVGMVLTFAAIFIYVMSDDLAFLPHG